MDENKMPIRILLVDESTIFRESIRKAFETEPRFAVVGETKEGEEVLALIQQLNPDILLMEYPLSLLSSADILQSMSGHCKNTRIILLAAEIERNQIAQVFKLGARGLMLKEESLPALFSCIDSVMSGMYWIGSKSYSDLEQILSKIHQSKNKTAKSKNYNLTPQEIRIIAAAASEKTNKKIAEQLSISEQTVKHHLTNIFDKLGVYSRLELTLFALHHKLIEDQDPDRPASK